MLTDPHQVLNIAGLIRPLFKSSDPHQVFAKTVGHHNMAPTATMGHHNMAPIATIKSNDPHQVFFQVMLASTGFYSSQVSLIRPLFKSSDPHQVSAKTVGHHNMAPTATMGHHNMAPIATIKPSDPHQVFFQVTLASSGF